MQAIYSARRQKLLENKPVNSMVVIFSGRAPMKSLDEAYPFDVDRNFFYLTGIERENMILVMRKDYLGHYSESLYIEPYDEWLAKWVGGRMRTQKQPPFPAFRMWIPSKLSPTDSTASSNRLAAWAS